MFLPHPDDLQIDLCGIMQWSCLHIFQGFANTAPSLSAIITNLNIKESRTKLSANVLTFFMVDLLLSNLFWD